MAENQESKRWWQTIPVFLTAAAGIITALAGFVAALHQTGILGVDNKEQPQIQNKPAATADLIAGKWSGEAKDVNGTSFQIKIDVKKSCTFNEKCGSISVSHIPCRGDLFLQEVEKDSYEFRVDNFTNDSSSACTPGAGEHFRLLHDETLLYICTYDPKAKGILTKTE